MRLLQNKTISYSELCNFLRWRFKLRARQCTTLSDNMLCLGFEILIYFSFANKGCTTNFEYHTYWYIYIHDFKISNQQKTVQSWFITRLFSGIVGRRLPCKICQKHFRNCRSYRLWTYLNFGFVVTHTPCELLWVTNFFTREFNKDLIRLNATT